MKKQRVITRLRVKVNKTSTLVTFLLLVILLFSCASTAFAQESESDPSSGEVHEPTEIQPIQTTAENIVAYDNRERILRIVEIAFVPDFTAIHVLVQNSVTRATFTVEHQLNTEDTTSEYIEITAGDGMGNISASVQISNPFFAPEEIVETFEEPPPIIGELTVIGTNSQSEQSEYQPAHADGKGETVSNATITQPSTTQEPHETQEIQAGGVNITINTGQPQTEEENAPQLGQVGNFTGAGWIDTVEHAMTQTHEFFLVHTVSGNPFYIIIDRASGNQNVHFLNAVTEWDLLQLIQMQEIPDNTGETNVEFHSILFSPPEPEPTPEPIPTPEPTQTPEPVELVNTQPEYNTGMFLVVFLVLIVAVVGFLHMRGVITLPFFARKTDGDDSSENDDDYEDEEDEEEEKEEEEEDLGDYDDSWDKFDEVDDPSAGRTGRTGEEENAEETPSTEEFEEPTAESSTDDFFVEETDLSDDNITEMEEDDNDFVSFENEDDDE